jgi:hypothetical protein
MFKMRLQRPHFAIITPMKYLGLASFAFFAAAVAFMLLHWSSDPSLTFSQNAARRRSTSWYYGIVVIAFLLGLTLFVYAWLIPTLHLPIIFSLAVGLGVAAQAVAGVIPETAGVGGSVHRTAAAIMYFDTVAVVGLLAVFIQAPWPIKTAYYLAFILMGGIVAVSILNKQIRRHAVALQSIHLAIFATVMLAATYSTRF